MSGHLQVHWPAVTVGNASEFRGPALDRLLVKVKEEFAAAWRAYCESHELGSGDGLARVVILIDIAPDRCGSLQRRAEGLR